MTDPCQYSGRFPRRRGKSQFKVSKRKRFSVVIPLSIGFMAWYFLYVILSTYAHDFMSTKVIGEINLRVDPRPPAIRN